MFRNFLNVRGNTVENGKNDMERVKRTSEVEDSN